MTVLAIFNFRSYHLTRHEVSETTRLQFQIHILAVSCALVTGLFQAADRITYKTQYTIVDALEDIAGLAARAERL